MYGTEQATTSRETRVIQIPDGTSMVLPAGTLVRIAQSLGVLERDLALGICQATAAHVDQSRRLQLDQLMAKQLDDARRFERMNVHADFDWMLELEQGREPARGDCAWVAHHDQHARVVIFEMHVIARHLDRSRRQQVGQCAGAAGEAALHT